MNGIGSIYLESMVHEFGRQKRLGERAMAQARDEDLEKLIDPESNSIGIIVRHLSGNMRSRWTDFLTTDGEKPDRNRDSEFFTNIRMTRGQLMEVWETGWHCLFGALDPLAETDLLSTVRIRGEEMTALQAINRQLSHYGCHVGQIVFLAKHFAGRNWHTLSMPRTNEKQLGI